MKKSEACQTKKNPQQNSKERTDSRGNPLHKYLILAELLDKKWTDSLRHMLRHVGIVHRSSFLQNAYTDPSPICGAWDVFLVSASHSRMRTLEMADAKYKTECCSQAPAASQSHRAISTETQANKSLPKLARTTSSLRYSSRYVHKTSKIIRFCQTKPQLNMQSKSATNAKETLCRANFRRPLQRLSSSSKHCWSSTTNSACLPRSASRTKSLTIFALKG